MSVEVSLLGPGDEALLAAVADDVFDSPIDPAGAAATLADPRHHLAIAIADGRIVGFASAVHYAHPDKPAPELWINEVGVAEPCRRLGLGRRLVEALFAEARRLGCTEAWVLTEAENGPARALYEALKPAGPPEPALMYTFSLAPGLP